MKTAKLFQNGQSQAVRLPKAFRMEGDEVYVKKIGNAVVLVPKEHYWDLLFNSLEHFTDDFMEERQQPEIQKREDTFT